MSFQLTGTQALTRTTGLVPASSDYTCLLWVRPVETPGVSDYISFYTLTDAGYTAYAGLFTQNGSLATNVEVSNGGGQMDTTQYTLTESSWIPLAYVRSGSTQSFYRNSTFVGSTIDDLSAVTWTNLIVGYDGFSVTEFQVTKFREWDSALTAAEIAAEIASPTAVIPAFTDCPLDDDLLDISGNGHHFSNPGGASVITAQGKYLVWTKQAGLGAQAVTGFGFQPKALILWSSRRTATGPTDAVQISDGMTDGIKQVCRHQCNGDNESTVTSGQSEKQDALIYQVGPTSGATPTVQNHATFTSFDADGFTLNWVVNDAAADLWHAVALGGDGFECQLDFVQLTGTNFSTYDVTGLGFTPSGFIALTGGAGDTSGYNLGSPFGTFAGFGFASGISTSSPFTTGTVNSQGIGGTVSSTRTRGFTQDTYLTQTLANTTLGGDNAINIASSRISAMGGDSYQIQRVGGFAFWTQQSPTPYVYYLALNCTVAVGFFDTPGLPGNVSVTTGFQADMVIAECTSAHDSVTGEMELSIGAWHNDSGNTGCAWVGGLDQVDPSVMARSHDTDAIIKIRTPAATGSASTVALAGTVQSVSSTAITFNFTTVPVTTRRVLYLAFGLSTIPPPEPPIPTPPSPFALIETTRNWRLLRFDMKPRREETA